MSEEKNSLSCSPIFENRRGKISMNLLFVPRRENAKYFQENSFPLFYKPFLSHLFHFSVLVLKYILV